ncbi:meiotic cell cortex C-terminal pleckstrin homology-domain-containing protein, partial [Lipomyces orientalis]
IADFENEYSNVAHENQRLFNRMQAISGKENVPLVSTVKSTRKQKNAASRAQDMQFVADIGQELLVECRKLQLLIAEKDEKLKEADVQRSQQETTIENLEVRVRQLDESEERYKEENWNLELKIQELESESSEVSHRLSKLNLEHSATFQMYTAQADALEALQARESDLASDLDSWKSKYESEMLNYEQLIANLQRDNEALSLSVANLNEQLTSEIYVEPKDVAVDDFYDDAQEIEENRHSEGPKTPERSPPMSPVKATPAHRTGLEGETLRASLGHAHRTITTLRGAVHREKTEKLELRRLLAEAQEEIEVLKNRSKRAKTTGAQSTKRTTLLGTSGRRSQYRVSNDLDEIERDMEWETFNGSNEGFLSANEMSASETDGFETALDQPTTDEEALSDRTETEDYQTGAESIPDLGTRDGDDDTETEYAVVNTSIPRQLSVRSGSDITDDDEEVMGSRILRSKLSRRNLYQKRDSGNFGTPMPLFDELGSSPFGGTQHTPTKSTRIEVCDAQVMTDPWAPERVYVEREATTESLMASAALLSMVALSKDEYNSLVNPKATPATVAADAESLDLIVLGRGEYDSLTNRKITLESVAADAESLSLVTISKAEYEATLNRRVTQQSLAADASGLSMVVLPEDEYMSLSKSTSPTTASLTAAAAGLGLISVYNGILSEPREEIQSLRQITPTTVTADAAAHIETKSNIIRTEPSAISVNGHGAETEQPSVADPGSREAIAVAAAALSLVVLPEAEYEELVHTTERQEAQPTNADPSVLKSFANSELLAMEPTIPVDKSDGQTEGATASASWNETSIYEDDGPSRVGHVPGEVPALSYDNDSRRSVPTAPLMLHAITQTMIGEYLWKYTRRKGRQTLSENRHKRYFWVHPYTRTLYWSDKNPSSGGEVKARSALIEGVRAVRDDNPFPPGLFHKSLVILTPTRTLQITCLTQERHETWFNALSFLLLRTNSNSPSATVRHAVNASEESQVSSSSGSNRSGPGRSNTLGNSQYANIRQPGTQSVSSAYNSRITSSAPLRRHPSYQQQFRVANQGSMGRLTSLFRPPTGILNQSSKIEPPQSRHGMYETQEDLDSADELEAQIEREASEMEGLENVRVCCDGKV